ncbi:MAG TPA: adenylate/guanylate cyclase domain-containing protein [Candidatus Binatia bacterium]|nr:adenylate/guanylate cyclase domain-containing protein [Candidatus Binatia bacterium]
MNSDHTRRKLTTILAADVAGYSRLMGEDEEATLSTLKAYREIIDELIARHEGRIFSTAGDSVLADFGSAVEAVRAAIAIQEELKVRNLELAEGRQMKFRIGINVGDVMVEGDDLFGDGVNVAARLEGLAEPGGICISGTAFNQVKNKLSIGFEDIGPQAVKNIAEPVPAFRIVAGPISVRGTMVKPAARTRWRLPALAAAVVVLVALAGGIVWWQPWAPRVEPGPAARGAHPLPDKPSIAVLPFANISGDKEQEYFSDGITNDIITELSKFSNLFVIASNSVFTYKGKPVKVDEVGRDLGVRYVLEGSVQKAADRVRINAQLVDAATSRHLWADRYDRDLQDVFAVQDEITKSIVTALEVVLTADEQRRTARRYTDVIEAYDLFLRGRNYLLAGRETGSFMRGTRQAHLKARTLFEEAIRLDPKFAAAYAEKSITYFFNFIMPLSRDPELLGPAWEAAQRSVALDDSLALAHARLSWVYLARRDQDKAIAEGKQAIALDPNDAENYAQLGNVLNWAGEPEEAIPLIEKAMRLNPLYPFNYLFYLGQAHYLLGQNEEAITLMNRALTRAGSFLPLRLHLAVLYQKLGRQKEAKAQLSEARKTFAWVSIEDTRQRSLYKGGLLEGFLDGLRMAGMPERVPFEKPRDYRMPGLD